MAKSVLGSSHMEKKGRRSTHCQRHSLYSEFTSASLVNSKIKMIDSFFCYLLSPRTKLLQIVRPGGMERPTDSYKETHNVTLSEEDTLFGGQVSNLQVIFFRYRHFQMLNE